MAAVGAYNVGNIRIHGSDLVTNHTDHSKTFLKPTAHNLEYVNHSFVYMYLLYLDQFLKKKKKKNC